MYYLQSRYYDTTVGRFVNSDDIIIIKSAHSVLSFNIFVYSCNDYINQSDPYGYFSMRNFWNYVNSLPIVSGITKLAGFAWDRRQGIWYSLMNPIQRKFGYCDLYDTLAPLAGIFISHKKMPFSYGGKQWMVWLWKGQYGITIGAEIGLYVYSKTFSANVLGKKYSQKWYRCAYDSERIKMSFTLYKNGRKMFNRPYQNHWWLTGFKPGIKKWWENLSMNITLGFHNTSMARAFCSANGIKKPSSSQVTFRW